MSGDPYNEDFAFMIDDRATKPRDTGLTMVIGDGPYNVGGLNGLTDLLEVAGAWIDWYKIVWSSLPFQPPDLLERKFELLADHDVAAFTGGNFLEAAVDAGAETQFFESVAATGCPGVEVSSTAIDISVERKTELIAAADDHGLHVHAEIGKKASETAGDSMSTQESIDEMAACLDAGADYVVFEMEEIEGTLDAEAAHGDDAAADRIRTIVDAVGARNVLFEVPLGGFYDVMAVSAWFVDAVGPDVNLGNVNPNHVLLVEQQRRGIGPHSL